MGRAVESNQLVESIAHSLEGSLAAIDNSVRATNLATARTATTEKLLWNLGDPVENIRKGAAQLAGGVILGSWRCLDVGTLI